jgi:hypothetical protein
MHIVPQNDTTTQEENPAREAFDELKKVRRDLGELVLHLVRQLPGDSGQTVDKFEELVIEYAGITNRLLNAEDLLEDLAHPSPKSDTAAE